MTVAVVGPTASGKSAVALAAARAAGDVEIVSVDAFGVYRGMDIGTAKPTAAERADVAHHLLDLAEPSEDFTVVRFVDAYDDAMGGIAARGHAALLVGGTGLYLRAVVDRFEPPGEWPDRRAEIEREPDTTVLHARLAALDPAAAAKMEPTNRRRVVRALEVCLGSGRPFSSFGPGVDAYPPSLVAQVGLRWPRPLLTARIEERFRRMLHDGLLAEVERLAAGPWSRTARQAAGYRELLDHLAGRTSLDEATELAITHTRQLAVRQERWFRRDPRIEWVDVDDDPLVAVPVVLRHLRGRSPAP
jgi:tRNA dimethylallyltransferase